MKKHLLLMAGLLLGAVAFAGNPTKPRVIVLTDSEVDDRCSMVHLLLHANDCDIAALIQSNSCFQVHGWSHEHWLEKQLDHYAEVYPNLKVHDPNYPTPDELRAVALVGDEDETHVNADGNAPARLPGEEPKIDPTSWAETTGSKRIVEVLLDNDPRKVYIQAWGGGNTAAKAFQILKDKHPQDYDRAISKVVMYNIWYQDAAGAYIERYHPKATMLVSYHFSGTWDYGSQAYTTDFVDKYLHNNHGPLCKDYMQAAISEGDSPSFFYALDNGLRSYEDPTYGGWGGMFYKVKGFDNVYRDIDAGSYNIWREFILREFEARANWCVTTDRKKANHRPETAIVGGNNLTVKSGQTVTIRATAIDNDPLDYEYLWPSVKEMIEQHGSTKEKWIQAYEAGIFPKVNAIWWQYREAGTCREAVDLKSGKEGDEYTVTFTAPIVTEPQTIHLIFQATDMGRPRLTGFQRVIITVEPSAKGYSSVKPGQEWLDTNGKPIQAHGFQVTYDEKDNTYYWYGEDKTYTTLGSTVWTYGVRCYASKDFYNWEDRGHIIFPNTEDILSPIHPSQGLDRPHIIYNKKTKKWVCWFKNLGDPQFYTVLQADNFMGPYTIMNSGFLPNGYESGDFDLYVDESTGKAYVWFERPHWELICCELSDDYLGVKNTFGKSEKGRLSHHFVGRRPPYTREAPTHFVHNGKHYLFTSGTTGYYPNESMICTFSDYHGEYKDLGNPHPSDETHTSFGSQITDVIKIPGKKDLYVAVADRWMPQIEGTQEAQEEFKRMIEKYKDLQPKAQNIDPIQIQDRSNDKRTGWDVTYNARYVFLPITWQGDKPVIEWKDEWRLEDYE